MFLVVRSFILMFNYMQLLVQIYFPQLHIFFHFLFHFFDSVKHNFSGILDILTLNVSTSDIIGSMQLSDIIDL